MWPVARVGRGLGPGARSLWRVVSGHRAWGLLFVASVGRSERQPRVELANAITIQAITMYAMTMCTRAAHHWKALVEAVKRSTGTSTRMRRTCRRRWPMARV